MSQTDSNWTVNLLIAILIAVLGIVAFLLSVAAIFVLWVVTD